MEDIIKFNEEIYENGTVTERYAKPQDATKPKTNISVAYFCYGKDTRLQKPFVLDNEGKIVFL